MKKIITTIALLLLLAAVPLFGASAETPTGLTAFANIATMNTFTFNDLVSNHWAYSGIKACYDRGILIGYPDGSFNAEEDVLWSHAVTIAARIHSIYYGNELVDTLGENDEWFTPYYKYCAKYKLLPSGCPAASEFDKKEINRYDLAYIFSKLISRADMPVISDLTIPDLSVVPAKYVEAVKTMYSAGIMIGMEHNAFNGTSYTTRAQIAEVVSRLLIPSEREGNDKRINEDMARFEANLENDSVAVQIKNDLGDNADNTYYCLYKRYVNPQEEQYSLFATDGNGNTRCLYSADLGDYLNNISTYNGKVYFCRCTSGTASGALLCYDPDTLKISTVYSGSIVESYCFYDGALYALLFTDYNDNIENYRYSFGRIKNGNFAIIRSGYFYNDVKYFQPYGWNGKIYFKLSSKNGPTLLYSYDIANDLVKQLSDVNINTSFFEGHVMYFLAFDDTGNYDSNLYALSLEVPEVINVIGTFPPQTVNHSLRSLYKFDDLFYCLTAFNRNVYSMDASGNSRLALSCGGIYNSLCFTEDKAILVPTTLTTCNANEIKIYSAKTLAVRDLYGDWLGMSCYYEGKHFVPDDSQFVLKMDHNVSSVTNLIITVPEAYYNGDDFVVLAKYENNTGDKIKLRSYIVNIAVDGVYVSHHVNRMSGYELKNHALQTFTFVIGKDDMPAGFDPAAAHVEIEIIPTYDVVPK